MLCVECFLSGAQLWLHQASGVQVFRGDRSTERRAGQRPLNYSAPVQERPGGCQLVKVAFIDRLNVTVQVELGQCPKLPEFRRDGA